MITRDQIREDVTIMLMDILALERIEIRPDARFMADLAGESIEMLELAFQCEKKYGVKVRFEQMLGKQELEFTESGAITPASIRRIESDYPFLDVSRLPAEPKRDQLVDLLTVNAIVEFLHRILNPAPISATSLPQIA